MPQKPFENPVIHFSSATYKCEAQIRRLFHLGAKKTESALENIREGLRLAMQHQLRFSQVLGWLIAEEVPNARRWAGQYDKISAKEEIAQKVVKKELTWKQANDLASRPREPKSAEALRKELIHRLAVHTVKTEQDEQDIAHRYFAEVERVRGNNYDGVK